MVDFDYQRYTNGGWSVDIIDGLLLEASSIKIPKIPIPYIGAYMELAMWGIKIGVIIKLSLLRKERLDLELLVSKQIHLQKTHKIHDLDVIN